MHRNDGGEAYQQLSHGKNRRQLASFYFYACSRSLTLKRPRSDGSTFNGGAKGLSEGMEGRVGEIDTMNLRGNVK